MKNKIFELYKPKPKENFEKIRFAVKRRLIAEEKGEQSKNISSFLFYQNVYFPVTLTLFSHYYSYSHSYSH